MSGWGVLHRRFEVAATVGVENPPHFRCDLRISGGHRPRSISLLPQPGGFEGSSRQCRFGLWVTRGHPSAEDLNDEQTNDQNADAHEDLKAAFLSLEANLAGGGKREHEGERVQAVAPRMAPNTIATAAAAGRD
jgi:hypothetical protein